MHADRQKQKLSSSRSKRRVIESDEEEEEIESAPVPRKAPLQQTSSMVRADDQAAMEAIMTMDVDLDDDDDVREPTPKPAQAKPVSKDGGTKRKRRRVKKSRTEKDAKGYMGEFDRAMGTITLYSLGAEITPSLLPCFPC